MYQPKINSFSFTTHLFLLLFLLIPATGDLISDRQALLDFSSAVPHGRKLNWDLATPICTSWDGVTCTSDGTRVLALRLPGFGFSGPIPAHTLGRLDALRILSLRSNRLSGSLPSDIFTLPSLRYLNLSNNNLSGSIPSSLQRFPNSAFTGNPHLCLSDCYPVIPSPSPSPSSLPPPAIFSKEKERSRNEPGAGTIIAVAVGGAATLVLLVLLILVCCLRKKCSESHDVSKINSFSFTTHLFLLLFLLIPATGDLISDRQALLDFSSALPHGRKLNWDLTTPICTSWVGVTCSTSDGTRVLALRLPGFGLSGPIPEPDSWKT